MKTRSTWVTHTHTHTLVEESSEWEECRSAVGLPLLLSDRLNYADSVINKVTAMQKQKEADTYV